MSDTKSKAEICDMLRFEQLCYSSRRPPVKNLGLAAQFLIGLSHNGQFPMAFHGGWAMFLRGSSRQTEDIDVSVNATIDYVKSILLQYARVAFPLSHGATRVMIFIHTGGVWNEGVPAHPIRVHVVINGQLNTPYNIPAGTEFIAPVQIQPTPLGTDMVIVTNIFFQFQGKLDAYIKRQSLEYIAMTTTTWCSLFAVTRMMFTVIVLGSTSNIRLYSYRIMLLLILQKWLHFFKELWA